MLMEGLLSKWTNVMQGWQYRWFVLDEYNGVLSYYTSKEKMIKGVRRGCVRLKHAIIGIDNEDDSTFTVKVDHKTFHFQARDADEREQWTRALEVVIQLQMAPNKNFNQRYRPNLPEFEKHLAESDSYLQIVLEQAKQLRTKREQLTGPGRSKLDSIADATDQMTEYMKHALVILQIAKNECLNPVSPFQENAIDSRDSQIQSATASVSVGSDTSGSSEIQEHEASKASMARQPSRGKINLSESEDTRLPPLLPWTSYSSDDEYYDAEDTFDHQSKTDEN